MLRGVTLALTVAVLAGAATGSAGTAAVCERAATRATLDRFVVAFNRGDVRTVDTLFGAIGVFHWYSTTAPGERRGEAAYNRQTLVPYLRARVRAGERLRLVGFRFNAEPARSLGHVNGTLRRRARGYAARTFAYKGAADCSSGHPVLIVWSMAGPLN